MSDLIAHGVDPDDELRHRPEADPLWNESYYLDFVAEQGAVAGYARIGLYPNLGVTWWTTMIVRAGRPLTASVAYDLPPPAAAGLGIGSRGYQIDLTVDEPLSVMTLHCTTPAAVHADPASVYSMDPGQPSALGIDLAWATEGQPYHYGLTTRYEVPCRVTGEITVGGERVAVDGHGQRDHSWGVRDWWAFGWCWAAARLDDGTTVHFADIRMPDHPLAFGYVQPPDGQVHPVEALQMTEEPSDSGLPTRGFAHLEPSGIELDIRPIAFGPLLLIAPDGRRSRFSWAVSRFDTADGRVGTGWIEWNQPDPPPTER